VSASVRVVVLTTDTSHHAYYVARLAQRFPPVGVVLETRSPAAPFPTFHPFEADRDAYERETLLADVPVPLRELAPTHEVGAANDAVAHVRGLRPDVVLVFGTGLLLPEAIGAAPLCLNLHGGDPEEYRGLDTHLWAVYHGDFDGIVTTLHAVDEALDTGAIVERAPVPLPDELYQLRAANTDVCVELTVRAARDRSPAVPQRRRGRYYSFMPAVLKDVCLRRWSRRTVVA